MCPACQYEEDRYQALAARVAALEKQLRPSEWVWDDKLKTILHTAPFKPAAPPPLAAPVVPPLPGHPRFEMIGESRRFLTQNGLNEDAWFAISALKKYGEALEACCAIARCWFLDEAERIQFDSPFHSKAKSLENANLWAAYARERGGK